MVVPSRFEPCGLTQLYALRYGTVPVVRAVGGLADTVVDANPHHLAQDSATGFLFDAAEPQALVGALRRAIACLRDAPTWARIMLRGMAQDFSWSSAAEQYIALYEDAIRRPK